MGKVARVVLMWERECEREGVTLRPVIVVCATMQGEELPRELRKHRERTGCFNVPAPHTHTTLKRSLIGPPEAAQQAIKSWPMPYSSFPMVLPGQNNASVFPSPLVYKYMGIHVLELTLKEN